MQTQEPTMMTILLYGFLGKKFGRVHKYAVKSPAEAIRALCATLKGFKEDVIKGGAYKVCSGDKVYSTKDRLHDIMPLNNTLRIIPTIQGAGGKVGAAVMIIIGIVLIVWSGGTYGYDVMSSGVSMWGAAVYAAGMYLVVTGVATLMAPSPPSLGASAPPISRTASSKRNSKMFNGAQNTSAQGNPVPICYGQLMVGSQVISAGLSVDQV